MCCEGEVDNDDYLSTKEPELAPGGIIVPDDGNASPSPHAADTSMNPVWIFLLSLFLVSCCAGALKFLFTG